MKAQVQVQIQVRVRVRVCVLVMCRLASCYKGIVERYYIMDFCVSPLALLESGCRTWGTEYKEMPPPSPPSSPGNPAQSVIACLIYICGPKDLRARKSGNRWCKCQGSPSATRSGLPRTSTAR